MTDKSWEYADSVTERYYEYERLYEAAKLMEWLKLCESPIERMLGAELAFQWFAGQRPYVFIPSSPLGFDHFSEGREGPRKDWLIQLSAQRQVGKNRADFMIHAATNRGLLKVVIECDGHDFHERDKQQALRDRSRDRKMIADGLVVLRFTGSEIFRNALKCSAEIADYVENWMVDNTDYPEMSQDQKPT